MSAAGHGSFAVDLRSHGESDTPEDGYDSSTAARDLSELVDVLDLSGVVAVGQSWGGNVVVALAAARPDAITGLALVDGGWLDLSSQFSSWEAAEAALTPPDVSRLTAHDLRRYLSSSHPDWSATAIDATMANLRVSPDGTLSRRLAVPDHMAIVRSMWERPPWSDFSHVAAPVLLLPAVPEDAKAAAGRRDVVARAAAAARTARVREYIGADHDIHAQRPDALAEDLLGLAAQVDAQVEA